MTSAAFLVAFVAVYLVSVWTRSGQAYDIRSFAAAGAIQDTWGTWGGWFRQETPLAASTIGCIALVVAAERRRWLACLIAPLLFVGAVLVTRLLKLVLLDRPFLGDYGYLENTYPAGHTAVLTSLCLGILILVPRRFRSAWLSALAAVVIILGALASVVSYAHRPSDVVGSLLLVGAIAVPLRALYGEDILVGWPRSGWVGAALAALTSAVLFALAAGGAGAEQSTDRLIGVAWAFAIICAALALLTAVSRTPTTVGPTPTDVGARR